MRTFLSLLVGFALAALVFTNPGPADFEAFVQAHAEERLAGETGDGPLGRALARLGSNVAAALANRISDHQNYVLFSCYTIDLGGDAHDGEQWRFLGIAGHFFELEAPDLGHGRQ